MTTDPRARALHALARFQVTDATVGETLHHLAEITIDAIPAAEIAGMTMLDADGRPTTAVYTAEDSPEIDAAQYAEGRGPCLDAWRENRIVRIDDTTTTTEEYPAFTAACAAHGIHSTLSLPLATGTASMGAMNLYARRANCFSELDDQVGADLAGSAAAVLANVSAYWTAFDLSQQLTEALETRAVIEQAKGILMARAPDLTADDAFDLLRRASQRENVKLREIAQRLVSQRNLSEP